MEGTNFQTFHQMKGFVNDQAKQALGIDSVQTLDMKWVTVGQNKRLVQGAVDETDVATFTVSSPGSLKSLKVSMEPQQSGTGTPAPDNVRPITGWTGVKVWDDPKHGGNVNFNQLIHNGNFSEGQSYWANEGTGAVTVSDGVMEITPSGNFGKRLYVPSNARPTIVPGHTYLFAVDVKKNFSVNIAAINANMGSCYYQGYLEKTNEWDTVWTKGTGTPSTGTIAYMYFADIGTNYVADSGQKIWIKNIRLFDLTQMFGAGNEPATFDEFKAIFPADYYPYNAGEITAVSAVNGDPYRHYTVTFPEDPGTVYGGTLDLVSGELTVDRASITLNGTQETNATAFDGTENILARYALTDPGKSVSSSSSPDAICNMLGVCASSFATSFDTWKDSETNHNTFTLSPDGQYMAIAIADTSLNTLELLNAYLADNPVQVVYQLATPETYQLTAQDVETLAGENNIWSNAGNVTVEYYDLEEVP